MKRYRFSSRDEETSRRAGVRKFLHGRKLTDEQREAVLDCLIKCRNNYFKTLADEKVSGKEQAQILAQYTKEEQLIMLTRFDLNYNIGKIKIVDNII